MVFFNIAKAIMKFILFFTFRIKVYGRENMPKEGGMIVAINHRSAWDIPVVAANVPRQLGFMAKAEFFDNKFFNSLFRSLGAFPVHRGKGDIGAIKAALTRLRNNEIVAMFPEGTRVKEGQNVQAKGGAVLIATRAKVPILPIHIIGGYKWLSKVTIVIGKPIFYDEYYGEKIPVETIQDLSDKLLKGIKALDA